MFPERRLHVLDDGQLAGNIIVTADGRQHELDDHHSFDQRVKNCVIGTNLISLTTQDEIAEGRRQTLAGTFDSISKPPITNWLNSWNPPGNHKNVFASFQLFSDVGSAGT